MKEVFAGGPNGGLAVERSAFIRSTYLHLGGAMIGFIVLSAVMQMMGLGKLMLAALSTSKYMWLAFMGGFMLVGKLASGLADNAESNQKQLMGLGGYVVAEALIFAPLLTLAGMINPEAIPAAGLVTLLLVGGLTWTAFSTKTDFSFLGGFLRIAGMVALGAIIAGVIFGFSLGIWFSAAMVLFAGGCVLKDTSDIIHHYPADRPAGAALHLFASIALMFWYVLRILLELSRSK
ncbi:Bax inhibitor-1 family protein [Chitinimonas sp.]|uniref:Bax inhibitor-1/YccA family protein n=1 Tax=Chitinimonas sp. TaxID=1934313 RepID=UPI0035B3C6B6